MVYPVKIKSENSLLAMSEMNSVSSNQHASKNIFIFHKQKHDWFCQLMLKINYKRTTVFNDVNTLY
jgi:hypothetical protein